MLTLVRILQNPYQKKYLMILNLYFYRITKESHTHKYLTFTDFSDELMVLIISIR
jgi:hypothetical protein